MLIVTSRISLKRYGVSMTKYLLLGHCDIFGTERLGLVYA